MSACRTFVLSSFHGTRHAPGKSSVGNLFYRFNAPIGALSGCQIGSISCLSIRSAEIKCESRGLAGCIEGRGKLLDRMCRHDVTWLQAGPSACL